MFIDVIVIKDGSYEAKVINLHHVKMISLVYNGSLIQFSDGDKITVIQRYEVLHKILEANKLCVI